jgi:hypothetical protein
MKDAWRRTCKNATLGHTSLAPLRSVVVLTGLLGILSSVEATAYLVAVPLRMLDSGLPDDTLRRRSEEEMSSRP